MEISNFKLTSLNLNSTKIDASFTACHVVAALFISVSMFVSFSCATVDNNIGGSSRLVNNCCCACLSFMIVARRYILVYNKVVYARLIIAI